jgi:hypothetical protein
VGSLPRVMRRIWWRASAIPAAEASVLSDQVTGTGRSVASWPLRLYLPAVADRVTAAIQALLSATIRDGDPVDS